MEAKAKQAEADSPRYSGQRKEIAKGANYIKSSKRSALGKQADQDV
jgi:hypothetical protein